MKTTRYKVQSPADASAAAQAGAKVLREGGLVAFPTETVYGLAANAADPVSLERLRELKDRPTRPFTVHIGRPEQLFLYVADPPAAAMRVMRKAWPGPITAVLPVGKDGGPEGRPHGGAPRLANPAWGADLAEALCYEGSIAVRCPDHAVASEMLEAVPVPVVAPSANPAGMPPPVDADDVLEHLDGRIDLLIDTGPTRWAKASTIVAFDPQGGFRILREGVYDQRMLEKLMQRRVLFVCTGNTCRSPMAEALAKTELARRLGCGVQDLSLRGWHVISAGTMGLGGMPPTPEADLAARELGGAVGSHRSQPLSRELVESSDLILCMTARHLLEVKRLSPSAVGRAFLLDSQGDIPDPIGSDVDVYRAVARRILDALRNQWMGSSEPSRRAWGPFERLT